MMSHTAVSKVNVDAVGLAEDQADTDDSPIPDPKATSSRVIAAAATARAMIAGQETADSDPEPSSPTITAERTPSFAIAIGPASAQCQRSARIMMIGIGTPS